MAKGKKNCSGASFCAFVFFCFFLLPEALLHYTASLKSSLYFLSNFYFLNEDSYTAPNSVFKPLLHTWSLAVEWQFYLVFPLIFYVISKLCKEYTFGVLLILSLLSFQASVILSPTYPDSSFYLLPTRAWELLVGSLISYIPKRELLQRTPSLLKQFIPIGALYCIIFSFLFFDKNTLHPSWPTILPVIGTAIFIVYANDEDLVTRLLSMRIPVFIGVISYSLYLWHQPLFAIFRVLKNKPTLNPEQFLLLFVISFIFAFLFFSLLALSSSVESKNGEIDSPYHLKALRNIGSSDYFKMNGKTCANRDATNACSYISTEHNTKSIILLGDSHAGRLAEWVYKYAKKNNFNFIEYYSSACLGIEGATLSENDKSFNQPTNRLIKKCIANSKGYTKAIDHAPPSIIIYTGSMGGWNFSTNSKHVDLDIVREKFFEWNRLGHKIIVVYDNPKSDKDILREITTELSTVFDKNEKLKMLDFSISYQNHMKSMNFAYSFFDSLGEIIYRTYAYKAFCDKRKDKCITHNGKSIFYTDSHHLSRQGAELVFDTQIKPVIEKVIKKEDLNTYE